jgi:pimeloyl-ACP methyl ester carboxylesterase
MSSDIFEKQHILTLDGGPVCVYESGNDNMPPVLLLHGAMYDESRFIWHHLAPVLSESRHVFAVDFPRHGKSRPWAGLIDQNRLVSILHDVIESFKLPPLPLIGLSMGGSVAIGYTLKYPDMVTGAVFMGPGGLGDKVVNQFLSWMFVKTPGALRLTANAYGKYTPEKLRKSLKKILYAVEDSPDLDDLTKILCEEAQQKKQYKELAMDDWQIAGLSPFHLKINLLPDLGRISCPVLWLRGKNDPLVGHDVMEEAARLTPKGKLCVVENAGHLLPLEQPREVDRLVLDFLQSNNL